MSGASRPNVWFAVSAVTVLERRRTPRYLAFESVYLVEAASEKAARKKGAALARAEAKSGGIIEKDGFRGRMRFAGIRKVLWCAANPARVGPPEVDAVHDGTEATFSLFEVRTKADLARLVKGKPTTLVYRE